MTERYLQAAATSEFAQQYFQDLNKGIGNRDREEWEKAIQKAEESRLHDRSVMDIMGTQRLPYSEPVAHQNVNDGKGSAVDWIKKAIEIEEKQ